MILHKIDYMDWTIERQEFFERLFGHIKISNTCLNINKVKKAWEISYIVSDLIFLPWKVSWWLGMILQFRDFYCVAFITVIGSNCINRKQHVECHKSICISAMINAILKLNAVPRILKILKWSCYYIFIVRRLTLSGS